MLYYKEPGQIAVLVLHKDPDFRLRAWRILSKTPDIISDSFDSEEGALRGADRMRPEVIVLSKTFSATPEEYLERLKKAYPEAVVVITGDDAKAGPAPFKPAFYIFEGVVEDFLEAVVRKAEERKREVGLRGLAGIWSEEDEEALKARGAWMGRVWVGPKPPPEEEVEDDEEPPVYGPGEAPPPSEWESFEAYKARFMKNLEPKLRAHYDAERRAVEEVQKKRAQEGEWREPPIRHLLNFTPPERQEGESEAAHMERTLSTLKKDIEADGTPDTVAIDGMFVYGLLESLERSRNEVYRLGNVINDLREFRSKTHVKDVERLLSQREAASQELDKLRLAAKDFLRLWHSNEYVEGYLDEAADRLERAIKEAEGGA